MDQFPWSSLSLPALRAQFGLEASITWKAAFRRHRPSKTAESMPEGMPEGMLAEAGLQSGPVACRGLPPQLEAQVSAAAEVIPEPHVQRPCSVHAASMQRPCTLPPPPCTPRWQLPLVIPMLPSSFKRPSDWPASFSCTDFLFLRSSVSQ